jgi:predicted dehydrogenase
LNSKIKIGLIGCGRAAELIYFHALKKLPVFNVVGVVDPVLKRRELLSRKFNECPFFSDIESEFINQIDAAIISTPPDTHVPIASLLLKNGKYVLVEKPLALSMDDIKLIRDVDPFLLKHLMMGFNHRYWEPVINLKEKLVDDSRILSAKIIFEGDYSKWNPVSFISDPLNDLGPHVFDLVRFIFNKEIISISAILLEPTKLEAKIKMQGDLLINTTIAHSTITAKSIQVIAEKEKYFVSLGSERIHPESGIKRKFLDLTDKIKRRLMRETSPIKKSYETQLNCFSNYIQSGLQCLPGFEDGVSAILAVESAVKSISENGKEIFLDEVK